MDIATLNWLIGIGTILMQLTTVALIALFFTRDEKAEAFVVRFALIGGFLLSCAGVVMSLVYSEYYGIVPCGLCWLTRIFLYPQTILFAIAAWKRDFGVAKYIMALSIPGVAIGVYHHYLQMGGSSVLPCPAAGVSDCAKRFLFEFNYITFPLVGATTFVLIVVVMAFVLWRNRA